MKRILSAVLLLSLFSCNQGKTKSDASNIDTTRMGGAVADDPRVTAKLKTLVSAPQATAEVVESFRPNKWRDYTPPVVSFIYPKNGDSIKGTVTIQIAASDNIGVASTSIYINNVLVSSSQSYSWTPADGIYNLTARALDKAGNSSSVSIVVSKKTPIIVVPPPATLPAYVRLICPPVQAQGGEGSCVGQAGSAMRSIEHFYRTKATSYSTTDNIFSAEFLYNQIKMDVGCGSGATMTGMCNFVKYSGICTWNSLPYSSQNGCDPAIITAAMKSEALNYRLGFSQVLGSSRQAIKTLLSQGHPLGYLFPQQLNYYNAPKDSNWIWNSSSTIMGSHANVLVGYDDTRQAYLARNSWGEAWGNKGYVWISYTFFESIAGYLYVFN